MNYERQQYRFGQVVREVILFSNELRMKYTRLLGSAIIVAQVQRKPTAKVNELYRKDIGKSQHQLTESESNLLNAQRCARTMPEFELL